MAIRITKKQRDKYGNVWLRDNYGGWTNEFGVRFTKTEHRRFGYKIRSANKKIAEYMEKYPQDRVSKSTDVGDRLRKEDMFRFRRKSAYKNYLKVTERIISGEQLFVRQPKLYKKAWLKMLDSEAMRLSAKYEGFNNLLNRVNNYISKLSPEELILLSRNAYTPIINSFYNVIGDIQKQHLELLEDILKDIISKRNK